MGGCFAFLYVCALHVCSTCRGQKRASDPLEMELQWLTTKQVLLTYESSLQLCSYQFIYSVIINWVTVSKC